jgi:hypothetical protein
VTTKPGLLRAMVAVVILSLISTVTYPKSKDSSAVLPVTVSWDPSPKALLVSYRDIWGGFSNQDPVPLIRIYGDGRVLVHHADYTPRAGEYELWLQTTELEDLLLSLLSKGIATFKPSAVQRSKQLEELSLQEAVLNAGEAPELFMVADDSTSVFEIHIQGYQVAGSALTMGEVHRDISWLGLGTDAARYPQMFSIQQLRAAELELKALVERDDLWKIR